MNRKKFYPKELSKFLSAYILFIFIFGGAAFVYAGDVYINILAVNGANESREKKVKHTLPKDLAAKDILDTAGLKLDYDVNEGTYILTGSIKLEAKESRTLKVKVRDIWQVQDSEIAGIKQNIDLNLENLKDTDFYETAKLKKEDLLKRLDFIVKEQKAQEGSIEKRIHQYQTYSKELDDVRNKSSSMSYWRTNPVAEMTPKVIKMVVQVDNPSDIGVSTKDKKYYMPSEIKPEHLVNLEGFDIHYDINQGKSYLTKTEDLQPREVKHYDLTVIDIWNIPQGEIDNLKDRARRTYKLLENTEYSKSADYLMASIKVNLDTIEESQSQAQLIMEHISLYRLNTQRFDKAQSDVEAMENLLSALRENLERSKVKNVLQRIQSFKNVANISAAIFGKKPQEESFWKVIIWVMAFVVLVIVLNYILVKRSKSGRLEEVKEIPKKKEEVLKA